MKIRTLQRINGWADTNSTCNLFEPTFSTTPHPFQQSPPLQFAKQVDTLALVVGTSRRGEAKKPGTHLLVSTSFVKVKSVARVSSGQVEASR
jgi:hypothetical protein